jgi:hypothetical protein
MLLKIRSLWDVTLDPEDEGSAIGNGSANDIITYHKPEIFNSHIVYRCAEKI